MDIDILKELRKIPILFSGTIKYVIYKKHKLPIMNSNVLDHFKILYTIKEKEGDKDSVTDLINTYNKLVTAYLHLNELTTIPAELKFHYMEAFLWEHVEDEIRAETEIKNNMVISKESAMALFKEMFPTGNTPTKEIAKEIYAHIVSQPQQSKNLSDKEKSKLMLDNAILNRTLRNKKKANK